MHTRVTIVAVAVVSLAVGYAIGQSQRTGLAASPASAAPVDPHAGHAIADEHAGHALEAAASAGMQTASSNKKLPAPTDGAKDRLNTSPRHGELVKTTTANGARLNLWVVYPERGDTAPLTGARRPI